MPVENVTLDDVCLIELASGRKTDAPAAVLHRLQAKGYLAGSKLTSKGRRRGERLKDAEHDLRLQATQAADGAPLKTVGGNTFHVSGGKPAKIRS